jgi:hypothetical protein
MEKTGKTHGKKNRENMENTWNNTWNKKMMISSFWKKNNGKRREQFLGGFQNYRWLLQDHPLEIQCPDDKTLLSLGLNFWP